jgi:hypothetical protein
MHKNRSGLPPLAERLALFAHMSKDICASANVAEDVKDGEDNDRYRRFAESCLKLAQGANDQATRAMYVAMAQAWSNLAGRDINATTQTALDDFNQRQLDG